MSTLSKKLLVLVFVLAASLACGSFWSHSLGRSFEDYQQRGAVIFYLLVGGYFLFMVFMGGSVLFPEGISNNVSAKRATSLIGLACIAVATSGLGFASYMPHVDWSIKPSSETDVLYFGWVVNYPSECRPLEPHCLTEEVRVVPRLS